MRIHLMAVVLAVSSAGVASSGASAMSLSFSWAGVPHCSHHSPAFTLSLVPAGTRRLDGLAHRGITVSYESIRH